MHIDACDVHAIRVCMLKLFSCRSKATPHPNNPRAYKLHEQPKRRYVGHMEGCEFRVLRERGSPRSEHFCNEGGSPF